LPGLWLSEYTGTTVAIQNAVNDLKPQHSHPLSRCQPLSGLTGHADTALGLGARDISILLEPDA